MTSATELRPASRTWGVRLVVSGLIASVLSGHSDLLGFPVPPDRILIAAGLLTLAVNGQLSNGGRLRGRPVHVFMAATVAWVLWSASVHGTLGSSYGFYALVDRIVMPFLLFALAPLVFRTESDRRALMKAFVLLGIYLGVTAVFELLRLDALVFPRYIMDPDVGILFGRARGPFASSEPDGMVMAASLFISALGFRRLRGAWRFACALAIPICALGVLLALTRSVWLGTVVGAVAAAMLTPVLRRKLPLLIGGLVAGLTAVLVAVPALTDLIITRLTTERSVYDRQNTNAAALRIVEAHPIDGIGWVRFTAVNVDWVRQGDTYPVTNVEIEVHNVVLSRAAELGLVGAALWVAAVLAGPVLAALRRPLDPELAGWRLVMVGTGIVWGVCIMSSPVPYPLPNALLWLVAGMVLRDHLVSPRDDAPVELTASPQRPG